MQQHAPVVRLVLEVIFSALLEYSVGHARLT